ncbi:hypothetical protein DVH24_005026 [Malus domestica]|uniref:Uncharacterized protein n=1 Tax=Malus domestica TaxID=3750 RepID=A0A498IG33_MALDO|nr:hypothetical protein DVH24_005026 [Malus domestica]
MPSYEPQSTLLLADAWSIENFASVAKYSSDQIIGQVVNDINVVGSISSGAIKSARGFQVKAAGLSGLDFGYTDNTAVYHTKDFYYRLQVNPTMPKYKRNKDWR